MGGDFDNQIRLFDDADLALEWCENRVLEPHALPVPTANFSVSRGDYELFAGLSPQELAAVEPHMERRSYPVGATILQAGDDARELFFLTRGRVSVILALPSGDCKRVATIRPGLAFGEMALLDGAPRSAIVVADADSECDVLGLDAFNKLTEAHPRIKIEVLKNLCLGFSRKLRETNRQLSLFD